ncbi:MAG: PIN domain-containing protein [Gemmataceae bacterium]|nr:PIN domain-containing protein [Gemmataceae bacterium]
MLLDTNVLARMAQPGHPRCQVAHDAVPCLVPQVLYELWVVATRPAIQNGLGFSPSQAEVELIRVEGIFPLLPDGTDIYPEWRRLVIAHQVLGKPAHDVRLVAAMMLHGLSHILTFNTADFARYPGITVLDPAAVSLPPDP